MFWNLRHWITVTNEKVVMKLAYLLPKRIAYYCFVRVYVFGTKDDDDCAPPRQIVKIMDKWEAAK